MTELPEELDALVLLLEPPDSPVAAKALEAITAQKGRKSTRILAEYLLTAPAGILATRAAMALETRQHRSCLPILYNVYANRPDLAEDIIPIFGAMEDMDALDLIVPDLHRLLGSAARLSTLVYLIKCTDHEPLADILLPIYAENQNSGAADDLWWALEQILTEADDATLEHIRETATLLGPEILKAIAPYLPAISELEMESPRIARAFLVELVRLELLELVPDSEDALVEVLARTICDARSPKSLVRDVEGVLIDSAAVEEVYASRDDIRTAFSKIVGT